MLVTMKNSELIDKLVVIAGGDINLVEEAIRACADRSEDGANLKDVVDYLVQHRSDADHAQIGTPAAA
jgi:hypothetical protein